MRTARCVLETVGGVALAVGMSALSGPGLEAAELGDASQHGSASRDETRIVERLFLRIANVRIEAPPPPTPQPSALLKFDLTNEGPEPVTDITLRIEVHERTPLDADVPQRVIVRPFDVRGAATIEPGFTVEYSMLFRNLPPDCGCEAGITVISAFPVGEASQPGPPVRKGVE
jgi:hypothetical protein